MWDSRTSAEQEQELTGTSGCLHFVFTGCAAFTGITLALTVPTELPAAVCLCVAAQVPSFRYSLDLGSLPASEQVWELCQKWLSHALASLLSQHSQTHTLPPPGNASWVCFLQAKWKPVLSLTSNGQGVLGKWGFKESFNVWFYPQLGWWHHLCDRTAQPGGLGLFWKKCAQAPQGGKGMRKVQVGM